MNNNLSHNYLMILIINIMKELLLPYYFVKLKINIMNKKKQLKHIVEIVMIMF